MNQNGLHFDGHNLTYEFPAASSQLLIGLRSFGYPLCDGKSVDFSVQGKSLIIDLSKIYTTGIGSKSA
jgi:hypothetical protein